MTRWDAVKATFWELVSPAEADDEDRPTSPPTQLPVPSGSVDIESRAEVSPHEGLGVALEAVTST